MRGRPFFIMASQHPFHLASDLRRIAPLAAMVIALHAALLAVPVRTARTPEVPLLPASAMQVRLLDTQDSDTAAAQAAAAPVTATDAAVKPQAQRPAPTAADNAPASVSPPQPALGLVIATAEHDADYYPRAALSLAPAAVDAIVIDYPPIADDSGHHVSELSLFIDEAGRVTRVRVEGPALPSALEAGRARGVHGCAVSSR